MLLGPRIGNLRGLNDQLAEYAFWAVCLESNPENDWQISSKVQKESNGVYDTIQSRTNSLHIGQKRSRIYDLRAKHLI